VDEQLLRSILREEIGTALKPVEQRLDRVEQRMDGLDQRMDGLDNRMGAVEERMDGLDNRMGGLDQRMGGIGSRMITLEGDIREIKLTVHQTNDMVTQLVYNTIPVLKGSVADLREETTILKHKYGVHEVEIERLKQRNADYRRDVSI